MFSLVLWHEKGWQSNPRSCLHAKPNLRVEQDPCSETEMNYGSHHGDGLAPGQTVHRSCGQTSSTRFLSTEVWEYGVGGGVHPSKSPGLPTPPAWYRPSSGSQPKAWITAGLQFILSLREVQKTRIKSVKITTTVGHRQDIQVHPSSCGGLTH